MHNTRYISAGGDAQLESEVISIRFVTAERDAVSNASRKHSATVVCKPKKHRATIKLN